MLSCRRGVQPLGFGLHFLILKVKHQLHFHLIFSSINFRNLLRFRLRSRASLTANYSRREVHLLSTKARGTSMNNSASLTSLEINAFIISRCVSILPPELVCKLNSFIMWCCKASRCQSISSQSYSVSVVPTGNRFPS
jgi:hypothetical protein